MAAQKVIPLLHPLLVVLVVGACRADERVCTEFHYFEGGYLSSRSRLGETGTWNIAILDSSADDGILFDSIRTGGVVAEDVDNLADFLDTPEKISRFSLQLAYDGAPKSHIYGSEIYSPLESIQLGKGLRCRDQHTFITYALRRNGYEAHTVSYTSSDKYHAVTFYRDKASGLWNMVEYETIHALNAVSLEDALVKALPGALKYWIYTNPDNADRRPAEYRVFWTEQARELYEFMTGRRHETYTKTLSPRNDIVELLKDIVYDVRHNLRNSPLWELETFNGFQTVHNRGLSILSGGEQSNLFVKYRFLECDVRYYHPSGMPLLSNGILSALRLEVRPGLRVSGGLGFLPNTYSLSVGYRAPVYRTTTFVFCGGSWTPTLWDMRLFNETLLFNGTVEGDFSIGVPLGTEDPKGVFFSTMDGEATVFSRLGWHPAKSFRMQSTLISDFPLGTLGHFYLSGGKFDTRAPINFGTELMSGVYVGKTTESSLFVWLPLGPMFTNRFADEPVWKYRTSTTTEGRVPFTVVTSFFGPVNGFTVESVSAGLTMKKISAGITVDNLNKPERRESIRFAVGYTSPF